MALKSFISGLKGEHSTLDEVLSGKTIDKKYRLIDLNHENVTYHPEKHQVVIDKPEMKTPVSVDIPKEFHDYMDKYADSVQFITRNGTPWLSEKEQQAEEPATANKIEDYYEALKTGPKTDVAVVNWRDTNKKRTDTGHTAVSVGKLQLGEAKTKLIGTSRIKNVEGYDCHAAGSFWPSTSLWREASERANCSKRTSDENPTAHARGLETRNTVKPLGSAVAAGGAVALLTRSRSTKNGGLFSKVKAATRVAAIGGAAHAGAFVTAAAQSSPGTVKLTDEEKGHGIMATLISPAQHDIMEHTISGLGQTYHGKYNVFKHNCGDFAEDMLGKIGIDGRQLVKAAMESDAQEGKLKRTFTNAAIPRQVQPDRIKWAMKHLEEGNKGTVKVDDQDLTIRCFDMSGQSTMLVETVDGALFKQPPTQTLDRTLAEGIKISTRKGENRATFQFSNNVRIEKEPSYAR
ncbi:MAG: hypothetical protein MK052_08450 [Alphaproteobacteria bacterium]|nr:hypothetical protein [Alphaproteobacteria bacterium]